MTTKTKTPVQLLHKYCERRFNLQDEYYEGKIKTMKCWTIMGFILTTCILIGLATSLDTLQNRLTTMESLYEECRAD